MKQSNHDRNPGDPDASAFAGESSFGSAFGPAFGPAPGELAAFERAIAPGTAVSCESLRFQVPLFVGGDLERERMDELLRHVAYCEPCASDSAQAAQARDALLGGLEFSASAWRRPDLWPGVAAVLGAEGLLLRRAATRAPAGRWIAFARGAARVGVPLAAAALFLVLVGPNLWNDAGGDGDGDAGGKHGAEGPALQVTHAPSVGPAGAVPANGRPSVVETFEPAVRFVGLTPIDEDDMTNLRRALPVDARSIRIEADGRLTLPAGREGSSTLASYPGYR